MYEKYLKRFFDFFLSLCAIVILSPILLALTVIGTIAMKGNPFFTQERPGKHGKIFKLIKYRSMSNAKDKDGKLLSDSVRLNRYGRILRSTSLDELPELLNILKGDMAIVGPRPLLVEYLPYYTTEESRRHDVRPGLTGLAQVNGRNAISWEQTLAYDIEYIKKITFLGDIEIIMKTAYKVVKRENVIQGADNKIGRFDVYRQKQQASQLIKGEKK